MSKPSRRNAAPIFATAAAAALSAVPVGTDAATLGQPGAHIVAGPWISQRFVAEDVSVVSSPDVAACVLSRPIDIRAARYSAGGRSIDFSEVTRSVAASAQVIAPLGGHPDRVRLQLKYPLDAARGVTVGVGEVEFDATDRIEASGDSLLFEQPETVALLLAGGPGERPITVSAFSADTGRLIEDALALEGLERLAPCLARPAPDVPAPTRTVSISFRVAEEAAPFDTTALRACGARRLSAPVARGELVDVTGFFAQTSTVLVERGDDGAIRGVYVPGIYEGYDLDRPLAGHTVSVAANVNDPMAVNAVKGCFGAKSFEPCLSAVEVGADGVVTVRAGECFADAQLLAMLGDPAAPEGELDDLLGVLSWAAGETAPASRNAPLTVASAAGFGGGSPEPFHVQSPARFELDPRVPPPEDRPAVAPQPAIVSPPQAPVATIHTPGSLGLALTGAAALCLVAISRRRRAAA